LLRESGQAAFHQVATFALLIGINPKRPVCIRPIADIKKNCHNMPMKIAVKAQKLLGISLEGSVG
jgi:hypothetical protein